MRSLVLNVLTSVSGRREGPRERGSVADLAECGTAERGRAVVDLVTLHFAVRILNTPVRRRGFGDDVARLGAAARTLRALAVTEGAEWLLDE